MRNKNTCIRLMDKLDGKLQEFKDVIDESKDLTQEVKSLLDREQDTI